MADVAACATELTSVGALVSAIEHVRDPRIVRFLIDAGADLHQDGDPTPIDMLYNAIERTDNPSVVLGIVGVLLDAYVDLSEGEYLHQALRNHGDHVALISLLLSRGADPNRITARSVLDAASRCRRSHRKPRCDSDTDRLWSQPETRRRLPTVWIPR